MCLFARSQRPSLGVLARHLSCTNPRKISGERSHVAAEQTTVTLAGSKAHRRLCRALPRSPKRLPQWFVFRPQLSRSALRQQKRLLLTPPPRLHLLPALLATSFQITCEGKNTALCPQVSPIHCFTLSTRHRSFYAPPGSSAPVPVSTLRSPCRGPRAPPGNLAPPSEGLSGGARALDQICIEYACKAEQLVHLACRSLACVLEGERESMINIYVQYWRFFCVFRRL